MKNVWYIPTSIHIWRKNNGEIVCFNKTYKNPTDGSLKGLIRYERKMDENKRLFIGNWTKDKGDGLFYLATTEDENKELSKRYLDIQKDLIRGRIIDLQEQFPFTSIAHFSKPLDKS